jgi:hypothetical protein
MRIIAPPPSGTDTHPVVGAMRRLCLLAATGCASLHALPPEQPCLEAGYAISSRTFECTGDADLANARYHQFEREYDCVDLPEWHLATGTMGSRIEGDTGALPFDPQDAFHCAFAIRQLACELVEAYGDDLEQYLASSDACAWVVKQGGAP